MKNKLFTLSMLFSFFSLTTFSQKIGIDSKGKSVFTHLSNAEARVEFSTEEPLSLSYFFKTSRTDYVMIKQDDPNKQKDTTVTKFTGFFGQLSMLNSGDPFVITNLSETRPGLGTRVGFQMTIDTFKNLDIIPKKYLGTHTWGINALFNIDNIKIYDPEIEKKSIAHPTTLGIEGNFNFFFKNWNKTSSTRVVFALNASILRTWNDDDLQHYEDLSNAAVLPTIVVLDDFDGRYGTLKNDITKFRVSAALPMYFYRINPIPYVVVNSPSVGTTNYHIGLFTNILNKALTKQNFKIPSSFGVGLDWVYASDKFSKPNLFIKGSISFGEL